MGKSKDPKYGAHKVTNTDEQEVVVNQSSTQEGGYDEPLNQQIENNSTAEKEGPAPQKSAPSKRDLQRPGSKGERKRPYQEEETE
ncbi:hypothetical protein [Pseudochryseolinea flava]|uniref:Uncharacterized protein n=1 Tax=Pseudochryseolinea flava TaxID=2059302 RepID=A0A364Y4M0_9BACT|nr:hypothetical protein [Pseudochryseolinea flava]RAW01763.1 hypothetical protein DQQ10_08950 [Pseudochryseolinea flava]